jgi:hypothetical protein
VVYAHRHGLLPHYRPEGGGHRAWSRLSAGPRPMRWGTLRRRPAGPAHDAAHRSPIGNRGREHGRAVQRAGGAVLIIYAANTTNTAPCSVRRSCGLTTSATRPPDPDPLCGKAGSCRPRPGRPRDCPTRPRAERGAGRRREPL